MRIRLAIAGGIALLVLVGIAVIMALRPTNESLGPVTDTTPTTTSPTTTAPKPARPLTPLPDGPGREIAGDMSVLVPDGYTASVQVSGGVNQVTLSNKAGLAVASLLWSPTGASGLEDLVTPAAQQVEGDRSAPSITAKPIRVAGMAGRFVRQDYRLYRRTRVLGLGFRSGQALTIQALVPSADAARGEALVRTLARTTVVRLPRG